MLCTCNHPGKKFGLKLDVLSCDLDSRPVRCLQFVLNTDETVNDMREHLAYIYSAIYVDFVVKNPVYVPGQPFRWAAVIVSGGLLKLLHLMSRC